MQKLINIVIRPDERDSKVLDLNLRYLLADTIENRDIGVIVDEGSGENFMEVSFISDYGRRIRSDLESLVISLGMDGMIEIQVTEID